jgi:DNA (cytosine-5)-methyltransferase 1
MLTFGSLFAGIGGIDLGLEWAGMVCKWQVEINPFCQKVLAKHWPDVQRYADVKECGRHNLEAVDLIAGGFPCQPHSQAGKQRGAEDDRNLWPEFSRIIAELRPAWVLAENVLGIKGTMLDEVLSDLDGLAYSTRTIIVPACAFDAPHRRERVFIVAYTENYRAQLTKRDNGNKYRWETQKQPGTRTSSRSIQGNITTRDEVSQRAATKVSQDVAHTSCRRWNDKQTPDGNGNRKPPGQAGGCGSNGFAKPWLPEPDVARVVDGVSYGMDGRKRNAALGNAVVPQVAEWIGQRIVEVENGRT